MLDVKDPWTALLMAGVLVTGVVTVGPAVRPTPRAPTVTRAALSAPTPAAPVSAEPPVYPTTASVQPLISGRVNLNTASAEQLEALPKVGPALAARIMAARPYRSLADLDRVKGVGAATLHTLTPLVTF
ncbi:ComEA family DNA-binding protein [Deinococcus taeanensis]|uniref:ComEA family DNA-binding protein n=1 Tax=Deinococcus taeanensis TaxID=2737050 RepID=UPI001CDC27E9|nr:ComEA family DNA-binding protein [Deinococcus taeanensis]UBV43300.1 ComEA family DNA-binding protein [Deinococcus taeanensis]